jgi:hypothetical protein
VDGRLNTKDVLVEVVHNSTWVMLARGWKVRHSAQYKIQGSIFKQSWFDFFSARGTRESRTADYSYLLNHCVLIILIIFAWSFFRKRVSHSGWFGCEKNMPNLDTWLRGREKKSAPTVIESVYQVTKSRDQIEFYNR